MYSTKIKLHVVQFSTFFALLNPGSASSCLTGLRGGGRGCGREPGRVGGAGGALHALLQGLPPQCPGGALAQVHWGHARIAGQVQGVPPLHP